MVAAFSQFSEHMSDSDMNIVMKGVSFLPKKRYVVNIEFIKFVTITCTVFVIGHSVVHLYEKWSNHLTTLIIMLYVNII